MAGYNTNSEVLLNQILQALNGPDFNQQVINAATSATTANFPFLGPNRKNQGSIVAVTDSTYDGTTGTLSLKGSNDGTNYVQCYHDDDTTPLTFTLATNSTYTFLLKRILFRYYELVYVKGNSTVGTFSAQFFAKEV